MACCLFVRVEEKFDCELGLILYGDLKYGILEAFSFIETLS